jgi:tetratricopeptide (TPR) repeat protein
VYAKSPAFPGLRNNQAVLLAHLGELPAAASEIESAIISDANDKLARTNQVRLLLLQEQSELALRKARALVAAFPDDADAQFLLGLLLFRVANDSEAALAALDHAQERGNSATRAEVAFLRGMLQAHAGRYEEAAAAFAEVTQHRRDAVAHYNRAVVLEHANDRTGALEALRLSAALDPNAATVPFLETLLHLRAGQLDDADASLDRTQRIDADLAGLKHLQGLLLFHRESWTDSILAFEAALQKDGEDARVYYNLGLARVHADKLSEAHAAFVEAARLAPADEQAASHRDTLGKLLGN